MHALQPVANFFTAIEVDSRIGPSHISLYMALVKLWGEMGFRNPVPIFSRDVMPLCKISGVATYHKCIRELHEFGYIRYVPSYYRFSKSLVFMPETAKD